MLFDQRSKSYLNFAFCILHFALFMLCPLHLLIVPDRISERETEIAVDVKDLGAVEGDRRIAVDRDSDAFLAGEFDAFDQALVTDQIEAVAVLGVLYALMEVRD